MNNHGQLETRALLAIFATLAICVPADGAVFRGFGAPSRGAGGGMIRGISADGSTVIGLGDGPFMWSRDTGLEPFPWNNRGFEPKVINGDGTVAMDDHFRWVKGVGLEEHNLGIDVYAMSSDGSTIGGRVYDFAEGVHRAILLSDDERFDLGWLPNVPDDPYPGTFIRAISADGSVVVGGSKTIQWKEAFCWTADQGMIGLGDLPGGGVGSEAEGVSEDGRVIVGQGRSGSGTEAFRWTAEGGMVGLGDFAGGSVDSGAYAANADGSIIVGYGTTASGLSGFNAFVWDAENGMRSIQQILQQQHNIDLTGWRLVAATDISADGHSIVGWGFGPNGQSQAWLAVLPEPAGAGAVICLPLILLRRRRA